MLTPAECRKQSEVIHRMAEKEGDPHLKERLLGHAIAWTELARKIERKFEPCERLEA